MNIPISDILAAIGAMIGAVVMFAFTVVWTSRNYLTRREHEKLCDQKHKENINRMDRIVETLKEDRKETRDHRQQVSDAINTISGKVIAIETQLRLTKPL